MAEETLRRGKNDLFNIGEELKDVIKEENNRKEELEYNNTEIENQQKKLVHLNTLIDDLQREEKDIQV